MVIMAMFSSVVIILLIIGGFTDLICGLRAVKRRGGITAVVVFGVFAVIPIGISLVSGFSMQLLLGIFIRYAA